MSGTIWLLVEDETDAKTVETLLRKKGFNIPINRLGGGGISKLAKELPNLIDTAKKRKGKNDCIVVLHDLDSEEAYQHPEPYQKIKDTCYRERKEIKHIVASDKIESWLLADAGICKWLGIQERNWDDAKESKKELERLLRAKGIRNQGAYRAKVLEHLNGDGDVRSPSMREALQHLEDAPCAK